MDPEFELDFITCEIMLSEGLFYEEARKQALKEIKEYIKEKDSRTKEPGRTT